MRIVHLSEDEKFLPLVRSLFDEAFPGRNTYFVWTRKGQPLRYNAPSPGLKLRRRVHFTQARWLMPSLRRADLLIVHGMRDLFARALPTARSDCVVVWVGWGFDYYRLLEQRLGGLLLDKTARLVAALEPAAPEPGSPAPPPLSTVAGRIDVFSVNPSEVDLLRGALPALRAAYHSLPSFTVEDVFERGPAAMAGADILLGNSGSPHNNHADAFDLVAPLLDSGDGRRLVVPLSYGRADYAEQVARAGAERFGSRFVPLRTWLSIDEYNARLASCGIVVMNHRRQKAVGNISAALYKGAKVFLRPENPLFGFFTGLGAVVHSTDALEAGDARALEPPSAADRERNREAIRRRFGRARVLAAVRGLAAYRRDGRSPAPAA